MTKPIPRNKPAADAVRESEFTVLSESTPVDKLSAKVADNLIGVIRRLTTPWALLSEKEQRGIIQEASGWSKDLVRDAVNIIVREGFPTLNVSILEWTVKEGIKVKLSAAGFIENITALASHGEHAVLVLADPTAYFAEPETRPAPDQPDLIKDQEQ